MNTGKGWTACGLGEWLIVTCILILVVAVDATEDEHLNRREFPSGFIFGTASASYQYEGAAREGGRRPSIWDTFSHIPGKINDGSNGDVAVDEYHRYKEDVKLVKNMGMDAYRFSISWSRILPYGTVEGGINKVGVAYYNHIINELLKHDMKPFVTIFHWDTPQALEDKYQGFLSEKIVKDFAAFAEVCFKEFGDRVKHWITLNEPVNYASRGYDTGKFAPGRHTGPNGNHSTGNSATEPYIVGHNLLLAHAAAVRLYKTIFQAEQKGLIGITLVSHWMIPYSKAPAERRAAQRAIDFMFGWYMDPITTGCYPSSMRDLVGARLPKFTRHQFEMLKGSFDFLGLNYYTSRYAAHVSMPPNPRNTSYSLDSQADLTGTTFSKLLFRDREWCAYWTTVKVDEQAGSDWLYVYPPGIKDLLEYIKKRYNNPLIFITENGIDEKNNHSLKLKEALKDPWRIHYYSEHLSYVHHAIRGGSDVRGYFAWSLLDNFEWANGYTVRFGLYFVDYNNKLKRYPKASVHWFRRFLKG